MHSDTALPDLHARAARLGLGLVRISRLSGVHRTTVGRVLRDPDRAIRGTYRRIESAIAREEARIAAELAAEGATR